MDIMSSSIAWLCSNYQIVLSYIIYFFLAFMFLSVICTLIRYLIKIWNVKHVIDLVNNSKKRKKQENDSEEDEEENEEVIKKINEKKLARITKNFPIMVKEIQDIYNKKRPRQISAIDLFENNLTIPTYVETKLRTRISSLTALGLLGTFVGLAASILKINPEQTIDGIEALISSIGPAISTTIIGVLFSLISSSCLTFVKSKYQKTALKLEEKLMLDKPSDTNPDYFYDSFTSFAGEKYEIALAKIVDNFLVQMKESLTKDLEGYSKVINDATINLAESEERFTCAAGGLEKTVDGINKYLQETEKLNNNFEQKLGEFTIALDNFNEKFKNSSHATDEVLGHLENINHNNMEINNTLMVTLKSELEEIKQSFELMKEMNYNFKNEIMNTPLQLDGSIKNLCNSIEELSTKLDYKANNALNDLSTKLIELGGYLDKITTNDEE